MRYPLTLLALGAAHWACSPPTPPPPNVCAGRLAGDLVITEFFNDPEGVDTGKEYIELYNNTGSDLELKGLTLYLGKLDGSRPSTHTFKSGSIPSKGYLSVGDTRDEIPAPQVGYSYGNELGALNNSEGLIGIRCGQTVLDEVRYTQPAKSGKARVFSGQFVPDATLNDDEAKWCDATAEFVPGAFGSPGAANPNCGASGQCVDGSGASRDLVRPKEGELVISEFLANPIGTDTDSEWLELYAKADVDLNGVEVSAGSSKFVLSSPNCLSMSTGSYAVLAKSADAAVNGGLPEVRAEVSITMTNTTSTLALKSGDIVVDSLTYSSTQEGVSTQLSADKLDALSNDDELNRCLSTQPYGTGGNKGTPGAANEVCPPLISPTDCRDPTTGTSRPMVRPVAGDLVITELLPDPSGSDTGKEWFEVLVKNEVDLNGLELANEGSGRAMVSSVDCIRPGAGSYVLFASSADPQVNGGLPDQVVATFGFALANSGSRAIALHTDAGLVDSIWYGSSTDGGVSLVPGAGVSTQLDPTKLDHLLNDDPSSFCLTPADAGSYGTGDRGTPGQANPSCL